MLHLYLLSAAFVAALLIVLALYIVVKHYNRQTMRYALSFFLIGFLGLNFLYFGIYANLPEVEVRARINQAIHQMQELSSKEAQQKERIDQEIQKLYSRNELLIQEFLAIRKKNPELTLAQALSDDDLNSLLSFVQHNYASVEHLSSLLRLIDRRIKSIEINVVEAKTKVLHWETSGGMNGDIDSYLIEENLMVQLATYQEKIQIDEDKMSSLRPLSEIWEALLKYEAPAE